MRYNQTAHKKSFLAPLKIHMYWDHKALHSLSTCDSQARQNAKIDAQQGEKGGYEIKYLKLSWD